MGDRALVEMAFILKKSFRETRHHRPAGRRRVRRPGHGSGDDERRDPRPSGSRSGWTCTIPGPRPRPLPSGAQRRASRICEPELPGGDRRDARAGPTLLMYEQKRAKKGADAAKPPGPSRAAAPAALNNHGLFMLIFFESCLSGKIGGSYGYPIGINGFGRIGRNMLRASWDDPAIEYVAVNDITDAKTLAHLLKYDSVLGTFKEDVKPRPRIRSSSTASKIKVLAEKEIGKLPWKDLGVVVVVESTGKYTKRPDVIQHIEKGGASKVIVSAPATDPDVTLVLGVNEKQLRPGQAPHPLQRLLHDELPGPRRQGPPRGLRHREGLHDHDPLLHQRPEDPRRARTRTCAGPGPRPCPRSRRRPGRPRPSAWSCPSSRARSTASPSASRPRTSPSSTSSPCSRSRPTAEEVNAAFRKAAAGPLKGILGVTDEPLVSVRLHGRPPLGHRRRGSRPRSSTGTWSRSWPGTTTSGAIPAGSSTWSSTSPGERGHEVHHRPGRQGKARLPPRGLQRPPGRQGRDPGRHAHPGLPAHDHATSSTAAPGSSSPRTWAGPRASSTRR